MLQGPCILELHCIMTNVMHKSLIYLSIYFCLTCFGLSFSPSSEAGIQLPQWFKSVGYGVSTPDADDDGLLIRPKHVEM
jgi:hypothetical protein